MRKITDYRNFWPIWLSCAGHKNGKSLFRIQKDWKIKTNYLYHREANLNKPLYSSMIENGFLEKRKRLLIPRFEWITDYVLERNRPTDKEGWLPSLFVIKNWPRVQGFIEEGSDVLFSEENLGALYRKNLEAVIKSGRNIFDDIFFIVLISNLIPFCKKYRANLVLRIIYTLTSLAPERDLMGYFQRLRGQKTEFPAIIKTEKELNDSLYPL